MYLVTVYTDVFFPPPQVVYFVGSCWTLLKKIPKKPQSCKNFTKKYEAA